VTSIDQRKTEPAVLSTPGSADRLNKFYARFDDKDFAVIHQATRQELVQRVDFSPITLDEVIVRKTLSSVKSCKAAGLDKISARLIKSCKDSLLYIVTGVFELSLSSCVYPASWKVGEIVPVSQIDRPQVDNDLRPVTLTSILSKCLEKVSLHLLMPFVKDYLYLLQFAYINDRSTNDAICTLIHRICKHLDDDPSNTAIEPCF
jgi:hypothetical protein